MKDNSTDGSPTLGLGSVPDTLLGVSIFSKEKKVGSNGRINPAGMMVYSPSFS